MLKNILNFKKELMKKYVNGKIEIPIAYVENNYGSWYVLSDEDYKDEFIYQRVVCYVKGYKELIKKLKELDSEFSTKNIKQVFIHFINDTTAKELEKYGFRYESIVWYLYNANTTENINTKHWGKYGYVPEGKNLETVKKNFYKYCYMIKKIIDKNAYVYERYENIKKVKNERIIDEKIKEYISLGGEYVKKFILMKNHLDETVEWETYDLNEKKVNGYRVTCISSDWLGLGNCRCVSHDPGYDYERILTSEDMDMLIEEQKKYNEELKKIEELPKGEYVLSKFKTWNGEHVDEVLEITEKEIKLKGVNCKNSTSFGGTCHCNTHMTYYEKNINVEDAKKILKEHNII